MTGTVYWITGLPGAGKTTIANELYLRMKTRGRPVVFLDGDTLRQIFGGDLGYDLPSRRLSAGRNSRLCKVLSDQGIDVICATVSLFHSCHEWNRSNIPNYKEIYVSVPFEVLRTRDQKGLYSGGEKGLETNVIGIDLAFEEPRNPDLILLNDGGTTPGVLCERIVEFIEENNL